MQTLASGLQQSRIACLHQSRRSSIEKLTLLQDFPRGSAVTVSGDNDALLVAVGWQREGGDFLLLGLSPNVPKRCSVSATTFSQISQRIDVISCRRWCWTNTGRECCLFFRSGERTSSTLIHDVLLILQIFNVTLRLLDQQLGCHSCLLRSAKT